MAAAVAALVAGLLAAAGLAEARTNHALVVAVTQYSNVRGVDLAGPNNDAVLVRDFLVNDAPVPFQPENVTVLADGLEGAAAPPTYAGIKAALAGLAERAERGDFVYLHLSGHGMQQPALDPSTEPDGLDEVFLPADIGQWVDRTQGVPNALPDHEIGAALDAIRAKGAFVWIVIDACHSGTATRAVPAPADDVTERRIDPRLLGIPDSAFAEAIAEAGAATRSVGGPAEPTRALALSAAESAERAAQADGPGGMVAFFAAQTVETTPEMLLERGAADARKLGLFTYTLFSRIAENPNVSYRQLGQSVLQAYAGRNRSRPTPLFEGDLDAPVFGTEAGDFVRQWRIAADPAALTVPAGRLHGLVPGSRLAVLTSPLAAAEEAIGYLEVRSADNLASRLVPVAFEDLPALDAAEIPANAYARLAETAFDTELVVALPPPGAGFAEEVLEVGAIMEEIASGARVPVRLRLVAAHESADLRLGVRTEQEIADLVAETGGEATVGELGDTPRLWFLPPDGVVSLETGRRPPSIGFAGSTPEGLRGEIADTLVRIFRATNLARLAAASTFGASEVEVGFAVHRAGSGTEPLEPGMVPRVHPRDQVHLRAHNTSEGPVDINVLYIGSDYSISHMYNERFHRGDRIDGLPLLEFTGSSYGIERMVVVLTEGDPVTIVEDLSFLEQEGVAVTTRSWSPQEGFTGLLREIASAPATRGAVRPGRSEGTRGAVMIYPLENMPR